MSSESLQRPIWWQPWVGNHPMGRYQEHYRRADRNDLLWDLAGGTEIRADLAALMMGRIIPTTEDFYILNRERRGLFVLSLDVRQPGFSSIMTTYIRLAQESVEFALKEWPTDQA